MKETRKNLQKLLDRLPLHWLKWITAAVGVIFVANLFIPDVLPLVDEIGMGWLLWALTKAVLRQSTARHSGKVIDVDGEER